MSRINVVVNDKTNELLDKCVEEYLRHHPEMREIHISRNKIIYEICVIYLKV